MLGLTCKHLFVSSAGTELDGEMIVPPNRPIEGRHDFDNYNDRKLAFLIESGAIWKELLVATADKMAGLKTPHVGCFFQLPYPVVLERLWHRFGISEPGVEIELFFHEAVVEVDERARIRTKPVFMDEVRTRTHNGFPITQVAAIVPMWGRRLTYFGRYADAYDGGLKRDAIVVPKEMSWIEGTPRAMSVSDFEFSLCSRLKREMHYVLGKVMPAYSITSLTEAPLPKSIPAFFIMPIPGHIRYNGLPEPVLRHLSQSIDVQQVEPVSASDLLKALKIPDRQLSRFEHQLLAMRRINAEGESALALMGVLSLCEWFVNVTFPELKMGRKREPSLWNVLKDTEALAFLDGAQTQTLFRAISLRNGLVHGAPPLRESLTQQSDRAGREATGYGVEVDANFVEGVTQVAFELYRKINLLRAGRRLAQ